jgi:hypothetical protein
VLFLPYALHMMLKMQPSDVAINGILKPCFEEEIDTFGKIVLVI